MIRTVLNILQKFFNIAMFCAFNSNFIHLAIDLDLLVVFDQFIINVDKPFCTYEEKKYCYEKTGVAIVDLSKMAKEAILRQIYFVM
jgi:hypothetical protein